MHNPDHPLVVMSPPPNAAAPSDDAAVGPPLISVHVAADLIGSYAQPGRKKMRTEDGAPVNSMHGSSLDSLEGTFGSRSTGSMNYMVSSSGNLPRMDLRSRGSVYDDLAVPVAQWDQSGACVSANQALLDLTGVPDASMASIGRLCMPENAEQVRTTMAALQDVPQAVKLRLRDGRSMMLSISRSDTTGLVVGVIPCIPNLSEESKADGNEADGNEADGNEADES